MEFTNYHNINIYYTFLSQQWRCLKTVKCRPFNEDYGEQGSRARRSNTKAEVKRIKCKNRRKLAVGNVD